MIRPTVYKERALLVGVINRPTGESDHLSELAQLTCTAGATVVEKVTQQRIKPDPAYYIGRGKVQEIAQLVTKNDIDVVIFDNDLSPAQVRNLEKAFQTKVLDRTELILDIFATHASTRQAKLQVELAQLEYNLPRLKRLWTHLSRIEGGIGTRGPGEKQIEIDRRLARNRITKLKRELDQIKQRRQREVAQRKENFTIALVGYTNAGKSTLMNTLTGTTLVVEDKLFSTLDTKTHCWEVCHHQLSKINQQKISHKVLLSDTVGFIHKLPHHLITSFQATLEEVLQADLLLHIVDAAHPEMRSQISTVQRVLSDIGVPQTEFGNNIMLVFNKIDLLNPLEITVLRKQYSQSIFISALKGLGLDELSDRVFERIESSFEEITFKIPMSQGRLLSYIADKGRIISQVAQDSSILVRARLGSRDAAWVNKQIESIS